MAGFDTSRKDLQKILQNGVRPLSAALLSIIVFSIGYSILTREIETLTDPGVSELAIILSIWIIYLELPNVTYNEQHMQVDYFYSKLSDSIKYYMDVLYYTVLFSFSIILLISAIIVTNDFQVGTTSVLGLPRYLYTIPFVYGFGTISIMYLYNLFLLVREGDLYD